VSKKDGQTIRSLPLRRSCKPEIKKPGPSLAVREA
jgi:hypothetical protein